MRGISSPPSPSESQNLHVGRNPTPNAPWPSNPPRLHRFKNLHYSVKDALKATVAYCGTHFILTRKVDFTGSEEKQPGWLPPPASQVTPFTGWRQAGTAVMLLGRLKRIRLTSSSRANQPLCSNQAVLPEVVKRHRFVPPPVYGVLFCFVLPHSRLHPYKPSATLQAASCFPRKCPPTTQQVRPDGGCCPN